MSVLVEKDEEGNVSDEEYPMFLGPPKESGEWVSFSELYKYTISDFGRYGHPEPDVEKGHHLEYLIPKEFLFNDAGKKK